MRKFECVNKYEYEADPHHADYREITAKTRNGAKYLFSRITKCSYENVLCRKEKGFPQW